MASWSGTFGSSPTWSYTLTATCTNRTSTQATIKMDLKLGLKIASSSTRFGYNYYWNPVIIGDSTADGGWIKVKDASPNWSDGVQRSYSYTATVSASAGDTSVTVKFNTKSTQTTGSSYTPAVSKTLTIPVGNTAPVWATNDAHIKIGSTALKSNTYIPENTSSITVVVPKITDGEGNSIKLTTTKYANNVSQGTVNTATVSSGTSHTFTDNISGLGAGTAIKYTTSATDGSLSASGTRTTWVYTKNTFTKATVSNIGSVKHKTGFSFTVKNGVNKGGQCNNNCTYTLSSLTSGISVYGTVTKSTTASGSFSWAMTIDSGTTYLKFSELKSYLSSSKYKGTIKLRLTSKNEYGSSGYVDFNVSVDLTNELSKVTSITYTGGTVTIGSTNYYCPQKSNTMTVKFTTVSDPLGGSVTYQAYIEDGHNSTLLGTCSVSGTTGTYSVNLLNTIGNTNKTGNYIVIKASTSYGVTSYASGSTFRTYSYSEPSLIITNITRAGNTATVSGKFTLGTDLPVTPNNLTYQITGKNATAYTLGGSGRNRTFNINISSLAEQSYTVKVKAGDTYSTKTATGTIPLADPMLALRSHGVGVNCIPASGNTFEVKGVSLLKDGIKMKSPDGAYTRHVLKALNGGANGMNLVLEAGGNMILGSGESATNYVTETSLNGSETENLFLTSDSTIKLASNCGTIANRTEATFSSGLFTIDTKSTSSNKGIKIIGSGTPVLNLWVGTGGGVLQSVGDCNLHLGRDNSTDMVFQNDRIVFSKHLTGATELTFDISGGERRVAFGSGTTKHWGMYAHSTTLGWYDWKNGRNVLNYNPSENYIYLHRNTQINNTLYLESAVSTSNGKHIGVNTSHDSNGYGDSRTHIGYRTSDGNYHHYFRGKGSMNINCAAGTNISKGLSVENGLTVGHSANFGKYEDAFRSVNCLRSTNSKNYQGRYGVSYISSLKLSSSHAAAMAYGASIESHDGSSAVARYLAANNCFVPMSDNNKYLGTSTHRWQAAYCTEGKFFTSTKSYKTNIKSVDNPLQELTEFSTDENKKSIKTPKEYILEAIKDTPMTVYNYKSRMHNNARSANITDNPMFIGFIADELKEKHPEFFELIGESGIHERDILDEEGKPTGEKYEEMQYDISDISMLGALWTGLQEALIQIDSLKEEINNLKGENKNV